MRVDLTSSTPLRFADGRRCGPRRRGAVGAGWLVAQDDATHACVWESGTARRCGWSRRSRDTTRSGGERAPRRSSRTSRRWSRSRRPDPRARLGVDTRPDALRPAVGGRGPRSPASRRSTPGSPSSSMSPRTSSTSRAPRGRRLAALVPARAAVRRRTERQRRRRAGRPPRPCLGSSGRRPGLGSCAATTSAPWPASGSRSPTRSACRAASCWSALRRRTRPRRTTTARGRLGPGPARRRAPARPGRASAAGRRGGQGRGLALVGHRDDVLDLVAVVDADDPEVPSLLLELVVERWTLAQLAEDPTHAEEEPGVLVDHAVGGPDVVLPLVGLHDPSVWAPKLPSTTRSPPAARSARWSTFTVGPCAPIARLLSGSWRPKSSTQNPLLIRYGCGRRFPRSRR